MFIFVDGQDTWGLCIRISLERFRAMAINHMDSHAVCGSSVNFENCRQLNSNKKVAIGIIMSEILFA